MNLIIKTKKYLFIFGIFLAFFCLAESVDAAWYDASWAYRKKVTITGQSGAGTNYQVKLLVGQSSGSAGANFHLENHVKTDFSDLRFTASDETTLLDYWVESTSGTTPNQTATVWVEVAADLGTNKDIYAYYGNSGASSTANGTNTFLFFDDFSGDLSKWTIDPENTDAVSISSGAMRQNPDATQTKNAYSDNRVRTASYQMSDGAVAYKAYLAGATNRKIHQFGFRADGLSFGSGYGWRLQNSAADGGMFEFAGNVWTQIGTSYGAVSADTWHSVENRAIGSTMATFVNGSSAGTTVDSTTAGPGYLTSHLHGISLGASDYVLIDDVRVRKIVATEPAYASTTAEESGASPNPVYYSVGQSTDDLKTLGAGGSAPTVTISGGAATFSVAQAGNIGVGDRVTYDTDKIAYISAKTNADMAHWTLVTAIGAAPADISNSTVVSIKHEYTTLDAAIAGADDANHINNTDLTAADVVLNIPCYYDSAADTTAVTVSGYTTDATRYIKIYTPNNTTTESNLSQRHNGKWDEGKYNIVTTAANPITASVDYTQIIGLEVYLNVNANGYFGIYTGATSGPIIAYNIVKSNPSFSGKTLVGIAADNNGGTAYIYNNLVYDICKNDVGSIGIRTSTTFGNHARIYNNTVVNTYRGIMGSNGNDTIIKNNIIYSTVNPAQGSGSYAAGTDYNITDSSTLNYTVTGSGNTHDKVSQSIKFADEANKDFHLHFLDTAALNAGTNLSADADLPFNTDIDGQTRNTLGTWDIGADEATTPIYRSVGVGATAALTTGTNNGLVITGSVANFSAPLPDNVGVGDALQYDSDNNGSIDSIAFIHYRIDSTHYILKKNDGTVPNAVSANAPDADWGIYRAYTSLSKAESSDTNADENDGLADAVENFDDWTGGKNLTTNNEQWNIACYANGTSSDTSDVSISGWTTAPLNYLKAYAPVQATEVGTSQRHSGKWDSTKYSMALTSALPLYVNGAHHVRLEGIQIRHTNSSDAGLYTLTVSNQTDAADIHVSHSIFAGVFSGTAASTIGAAMTFSNAHVTASVYNNVIYDYRNGSNPILGILTDNSVLIKAYNNTLYNGYAALFVPSTSGHIIAKNNLGHGFSVAFAGGNFEAGTDYNATDSASMGYTVTGSGNTHDRTSQTFTFIDAANKDFHLANTDAGAKNYGADLSADPYIQITTDIDGQPRTPGASSFDIGADERLTNVYYSVSGGGATATDRKVAATIQISNGVMIFSAAQTDNIGVGDEVIYGAGTKAYISGKIDQSNWYVVDKFGDKPADVAAGTTLTSIKRVWSSLQAAITGAYGANYINNTALTTAGVILNIPCYYDTGADTTNVVVNGYATGVNNYIKIYAPNNISTEVNNSQRHSGKWDDSKYSLATTSGSTLSVAVSDVRIDGLQIFLNHTGPTLNAVSVSGTTSNIYLSNSIIKTVNSSSGFRYGFSNTANGGTQRVWNNIIYNFSGNSWNMGMVKAGSAPLYVHNNTIVDCETGLYANGGKIIAKNNLIRNSSNAYWGTFSEGTDYNATDGTDSIGQGSNNITSATINFVDATNKDYHLASDLANSAKNAGADLSFDVNLPITTDIDGHSRNTNLVTSTFDIGADEATTKIYRSIAPDDNGDNNLAAISTAAQGGTFSVSGNVGTFTGLGANVGVGDVIQYDSDNNGTIDSIAFIAGRTSAAQYTIQNSIGGTPTATSAADMDWSLFRAYTSLSNAEAGTENIGINASFRAFDTWGGGKNIAATNEQWNIAAYANGTTADRASAWIQGWVTAPNNYINVYTPTMTNEVGASQRHQGKWDKTKYHIDTSSAGYPYSGINVNDKYVRMQGLQVLYGNSTVATNVVGIYISPNSNSSDIEISSSIIHGNTTSTYRYAGIYVYDNAYGAKVRITNNVIYNTSNYADGSGAAINLTDYNPKARGTVLVYNNTIKAEQYGIRNTYSDSYYVTAKNNIVQSAANGYDGAFESASDYNISHLPNDAPSPSYRNNLATTVSFVDAASKDFHLAANDTSARNVGADLSADANLAFNTDIDGHARPGAAGRSWDIGADQGATHIYYSVGQSTVTDLKTGTPTVTVSNKTATFNADQTGNIGVGDVVTYTGGSCFIAGKTSATVWSCQNVTGGTAPQVSGVSVTSIKRAFASLSAAESGSADASHLNTSDLFANNYVLNIPCYYDTGADTAVVTVDGWITAIPNYVKIYTPNNTSTEVNQSQRHQGKWDDTKYRLEWSSGYRDSLFVTRVVDVIVEGLQIFNNQSAFAGYSLVIYSGSTNYKSTQVIISDNIIKSSNSQNVDGVSVNFSGPLNAYIYNNIVYDHRGWGFIDGTYNANSSQVAGTTNFYNNTAINGGNGSSGGGFWWRGASENSRRAVLKNNIAQNCFNGYGEGGYAPDASSDNNISDIAGDTTGLSPAYRSGQATTVSFVDSANKDYHLAPTDQYARNFGKDLSTDLEYAFSTDIDDSTRNNDGRGWDIGADETATAVYYSVGQSTADLKTGSPTLSIDSSGNGTLSVAQTGNMGVGDYIEYGTAPYAKAYITGKTSSTVWTVQSSTGSLLGVGTTMPVNAIKHTWTTLNGAVAGSSGSSYINTLDLQANNYQLNIPCYYDSAADTAAVTISSYLTGPATYIKVYTPESTTAEANNSQRHSGKWDDGKYKLSSSGSNWIRSPYTQIVGLQISNGTDYSVGLTIANANNTVIDSVIIKADAIPANGLSGINSGGSTNVVLKNSIIYGYKNGSNSGFRAIESSSGTVYCYNITVAKSHYGFYQSYQQIKAVNTISYQNDIGHNLALSSYISGTNYNASDLNDAPGANSRNSQTFAFVDAANNDYHLAQNDAGAKNYGISLATDSTNAFSTDIDGHTRGNQGGWDIGADEGAAHIFYSVGQNTDDHKTGSPTITLSGYSATLSVAQTAPNMGVGDLITYTGGSCYISGKTSATVWNCQNATGGTAPQVSGVSVTSITHAFSSLAQAIDAYIGGNGNKAADSSHLNTYDLKANNYVLNLPCYYDTGAENSYIWVNGWTTGPGNYMKIYTPNNTSTEANQNQRHSGRWDDTKYSLQSSSALLFMNTGSFKIEGLQLYENGNGANTVRIDTAQTGEVHISNSILRRDPANTGGGDSIVAVGGGLNSKLYVWNNIIYDNTTGSCVSLTNPSFISYIYNNTLNNCSSVGIWEGNSAVVIAKNNIVRGSGDSNAYIGSFAAGTDYNATDGTDNIGTGSNNKISQTFNFIDAANKDFHLAASDTAAKNSGVVLSADQNLPFLTDIDGDMRPAETGKWDIGADEIDSSDSGTPGAVNVKRGVNFGRNVNIK